MRNHFKRFYKSAEFHELSHAAIEEWKASKHRYPVRFREAGTKSKGIECKDALDLITQTDILFEAHPRMEWEILPQALPQRKPHKRKKH